MGAGGGGGVYRNIVPADKPRFVACNSLFILKHRTVDTLKNESPSRLHSGDHIFAIESYTPPPFSPSPSHPSNSSLQTYRTRRAGWLAGCGIHIHLTRPSNRPACPTHANNKRRWSTNGQSTTATRRRLSLDEVFIFQHPGKRHQLIF